jgi:hypothetical protein
MGRKIVLTGTTLTDLTAPKLAQNDPIESAGSLVLFDAMHPKNPMSSGVPATGTDLPNVLWESAIAAYGTGTEASTQPVVTYANLDGVTRGAIERSGKGGIHVILSQADARVADATVPWMLLSAPAAFGAYQVANPTNDVYLSAWYRVTRPLRSGTVAGTYTGGSSTVAEMNQGGGNRRITLSNSGSFVRAEIGKRVPLLNAAGAELANAASADWVNPITGPSAFFVAGGAGTQNVVTSGTTTNKARWPSLVLYRFYVEDLTVSGRTYAEVDAIDFSLYTKEVLTPGGRYYGDTFTNPATIP